MIGSQSVKAVKIGSFARNSLRHALQSGTASSSRASSTSNHHNHQASQGGEFFTPAPAPSAPDYSTAFFTSAPAPSAGSALSPPNAGYFDPSDRCHDGRTGKGEQRSRNSAGSGWNFYESGRVAAVPSNSAPAVDVSLLIRGDEEEEKRIHITTSRRPSLATRARSSSSSSSSPANSSALIASANTRQAFQASIRTLLSGQSLSVFSAASQGVGAGWQHQQPFRLAIQSRSYSAQVDADATELRKNEEPAIVVTTSSAELPPQPEGATIHELPPDGETEAAATDNKASATSTSRHSTTPHPRRNRVRSASVPSSGSRAPSEPEHPSVTAHIEAIREAAAGESPQAVRNAVQQYRTSLVHSRLGHNTALSALARWHSYDEPVQSILEVFEEMLELRLKPNAESYGIVIEVLAQRDHAIQVRLHRTRSELIEAQKLSVAEPTYTPSAQQADASATDRTRSSVDSKSTSSTLIRSLRSQLASLSQDDSCTVAFQLYKTLGQSQIRQLPASTVHALLRLCIRHQRSKDAVIILKNQLRSIPDHPDFEAIALTLRACAQVKDLTTATAVFSDYLKRTGIKAENDGSLHTESELAVWDEMINAAFQAGDAHAAVSTFEQLTTLPPANSLRADARLLERMVSGFAVLGDGPSATRWAERITADPTYSTKVGLTPAFLSRSILLLASRISALDIPSASQACDIYSIMRNFAVATAQPYSGNTLQQLITTIIPYTFSVERTAEVTQLWDRLAGFVECYHQDVAQHPTANSYLAPESVALLEKARASAPPQPSASSVADVHSAEVHSQAPRESVRSDSSEHGSDANSRATSTSTAYTPPAEDHDADKSFDRTQAVVRPLSPAAAYATTASFSPAPRWDEEVTEAVQKVFRETKVYDMAGSQAAQIIVNAAHEQRFVSPELAAEALARCGRSSRDEYAIEELYLAAYASLNVLEADPELQLAAWHKIENAALIACANAGLLDRASVHRARLIEAGGAPSAEAYGTLILNAKDTTDDASVAIDLFEESRRLGVPPNTFLFNNLISRLSKARRTKAVLECFEQMKAAGIPTSSVTYGAVINACCKIGDVSAASFLFEEMTSLIDFVPKVPPYNTMIQFFVSTKPDRERALYYYQRMLKAGVKPSSHTYKLLLDCYGSLQPVDTRSMRDVFKMLEREKHVRLEGTHWAALINSYGLAQNDLDTAIETFESISKHAKSQRAGLPDAVTYEAILNSCLSNNRPDLVEYYAQDMRNRQIHSTAYCENARIKAFTKQGNLEAARKVFESLSDPPTGVAASGNHPGGRRHAKNRGSAGKEAADAPVYREPSSFEVMIRAEVKMGDINRAAALVERARQRAFPAQVIKGLQDYLINSPPSS